MTLALTSFLDWLRFRIMLSAPPPPPPPPPGGGSPPAGGGTPPPPPQGAPPPPGTTPPPSYGPPGGGYNEQAPNAVTMLVLAIIGYVICPPTSWVAFFMAKGALEQYPNCGMTKAAYWLGLINMILFGVGLIIQCGVMALAMAGSAASGASP